MFIPELSTFKHYYIIHELFSIDVQRKTDIEV